VVASYDVTSLSHWDLTKKVPKDYQEAWPGRPHSAVVHSANSFWQRHVFEFLAENGVAVDIEAMLTREDHRNYLRAHGLPVVGARRSSARAAPPKTKTAGSGKASAKATGTRGGAPSRAPGRSELPSRTGSGSRSGARPPDELSRRYAKLSNTGRQILEHLLAHPGERGRDVGNVLGLSPKAVNRLLHGELEGFCEQDGNFGWSLTRAARAALRDRAA
jgi:hypothetical protein